MPSTRKKFIQSSGLLLAAVLGGDAFSHARKELLLSFSTLGCPDWNFQQITDFAAAHGYQAIELRGILRQMDLIACNDFTPQHIPATMARMKSKGLTFIDLGSSANLHLADPVKRKDSLDEAKRYIDLAKQLNCPYIRVFPNNLPKDQDKQATLDLIINGLQDLGNYAKGSNVKVLMETHGDLVHSDDLLMVMQSVNSSNTGLIWDIANMWTITKEPPEEVYKKLKSYIFHTHVKDGTLTNDVVQYTLLGKGEVPVFEAIDLLQAGGYKGYYSFEWEKMWHPEIAEPEAALADYPRAMRKHLGVM